MEKTLSLLETVIVTDSFSAQQVLAGDLGTVVEIYTQPTLTYEVEFVNPDGTTRALLELAPHQLRALESSDVLTTRSSALAA